MNIELKQKCPSCSSDTTANFIILPDNTGCIFITCQKDNSHIYKFNLSDLNIEEHLVFLENKRPKSEDIYWDFVDIIKWEENYKLNDNYADVVKKEILPTVKNIEDIQFIYNNLYSNLMNVYDDFLKNKKNYEYPLGDDSTNDFIAHICSLGKEKYFYYFNNPAEMYKKSETEDYLSESFDYIWNEL